MSGHYGMRDANGAAFTVQIPAFSLDCPHAIRSLN